RSTAIASPVRTTTPTVPDTVVRSPQPPNSANGRTVVTSARSTSPAGTCWRGQPRVPRAVSPRASTWTCHVVIVSTRTAMGARTTTGKTVSVSSHRPTPSRTATTASVQVTDGPRPATPLTHTARAPSEGPGGAVAGAGP